MELDIHERVAVHIAAPPSEGLVTLLIAGVRRGRPTAWTSPWPAESARSRYAEHCESGCDPDELAPPYDRSAFRKDAASRVLPAY